MREYAYPCPRTKEFQLHLVKKVNEAASIPKKELHD